MSSLRRIEESTSAKFRLQIGSVDSNEYEFEHRRKLGRIAVIGTVTRTVAKVKREIDGVIHSIDAWKQVHGTRKHRTEGREIFETSSNSSCNCYPTAFRLRQKFFEDFSSFAMKHFQSH